MRRRIAALLRAVALIAPLAVTAPLRADPLPAPEGKVVLRVTGHAGRTNTDDEAHFDLDMLRALPQASVTTSTIWTDGEQVFRGLWLKTLVDHLDITGEVLETSALNEYFIDIPLSDAVENGALIAYELNGAPMSVREKGPLWVIYPYDDNPAYQSEIFYARSIWQMDRIHVPD